MLLIDLFLLRDTPFRHAAESPRAPLWVSVSLLAVGALFGLVKGLLQRAAGGEISGVAVADIPASALLGGNVLAGIAILVLVHIGICFFSWLAAKGVGGPGFLIGLYRMTAYALPLGIPALPLVAARADASRLLPGNGVELPLGFLYVPLAAVGAALFLVGMHHIFRLSQGKGPVATGLAVLLFAVPFMFLNNVFYTIIVSFGKTKYLIRR